MARALAAVIAWRRKRSLLSAGSAAAQVSVSGPRAETRRGLSGVVVVDLTAQGGINPISGVSPRRRPT